MISSAEEFVTAVVRIAPDMGYKVETNRNGILQIAFGNKKLHADHLARLYPEIINLGVNVKDVIEKVARGRPCTHKPMRMIIARLRAGGHIPSGS